MGGRTALRGLTLIETLVVFAILAALVGVFLPALQAAREAARRAECANHLKQVSLGALAFDNAQGELPSLVQARTYPPEKYTRVGQALVAQPDPIPATWAVMLLPYIGEPGAWSAWDKPPISTSVGSLPAPDISLYVCPSDPTKLGRHAPLSYVANAGQPDYPWLVGQGSNAIMAPSGGYHYDHQENGVFMDRYAHWYWRQRGEANIVKPPGTSVRVITDGLSQTMMFTENIQATSYAPSFYLSEKDTGFVWQPFYGGPYDWDFSALSMTDPRVVNGAKEAPQLIWGSLGGSTETWIPSINLDGSNMCAWYCEVPSLWWSRPSSYHPKGANVAYCDGRVSFLEEGVPYMLLRERMTSNRGD